MTSAILNGLENFSFDHPTLYQTLCVLTGVSVLLLCFMSLPDSPMLKAMGITSIQKRISATGNAIYWSTRASISPSANKEDTHTQAFGNIEGIDPNGLLIISIPEHDKWQKKPLRLANVEISDLYGAAQIVGSFRLENAKFDIYSTDRVVVWIRNTPLNLKLIEIGVARPDINPKTNIFDLAFATYYWGLAKGNNS